MKREKRERRMQAPSLKHDLTRSWLRGAQLLKKKLCESRGGAP
jgi:hypothetical protein